MPLGQIISAASQFFQNKLNAQVARENTDKTIAANKALAEYQYNKDVEMWNRGNVYNSPLAQMERLKAAGLNPNLVYGSGAAAGMAAGQLPKYNAPTVKYDYIPAVDIPSVIGQFQDFAMKSAAIRNTDAQATDREQNNRVLDAINWITNEQGDFKKGSLREFLLANKEKKTSSDALVSELHGKLKGQTLGYQVQAEQEKLRRLENENRRIIAATENLNLRNEYFAAEAIAGLFGKSMVGLGALGRMLGVGSRGGKAAGKLNTGTIRSPRSDWNSPGSWDRALRNR